MENDKKQTHDSFVCRSDQDGYLDLLYGGALCANDTHSAAYLLLNTHHIHVSTAQRRSLSFHSQYDGAKDGVVALVDIGTVSVLDGFCVIEL